MTLYSRPTPIHNKAFQLLAIDPERTQQTHPPQTNIKPDQGLVAS